MLLAVFVPMLVLSSLHLHAYQPIADDDCTECVHHHCGGHLTQQTGSAHDCVLCQFLSLPLLVVALVALKGFCRIIKEQQAYQECRICSANRGGLSLRGPPAA